MAVEKIKATDVLRETISIVLKERELFLLLGGLLTVITFMFIWPDMESTVLLLESYKNQDPSDPLTIEENMQRMSEGFADFILYLPLLFIQYGIMGFWSHASILGKSLVREGGINSLFKRSLWVFWRLICSMGWVLLIMVAAFIIIMIFLFILMGTGLIGVSSDFIYFILSLPLAVLIFIISGLIFLLSVSIHGEIRDLRLPIYKSFQYMRGNLVRATGLVTSLMVGFYFLHYLGTDNIYENYFTSPLWVSVLGMVALTFFATLLNLGAMTYGALYASKLVPQLKV